MIVYISGQMSGKENYENDFKEAECWLKLKGHTAINPSCLNGILPFEDYSQFMAVDFKLIDLSEAIFMLDGWQNSKGAKSELAYAKSLNKKIMYQDYYKEFKKPRNDEQGTDSVCEHTD